MMVKLLDSKNVEGRMFKKLLRKSLGNILQKKKTLFDNYTFWKNRSLSRVEN